MKGIEQYCDTILNFYQSRENGMTEEENQLWNNFRNSDSSFHFALQVFSNLELTNIYILFESSSIICNFIKSNWPLLHTNDQQVIVNVIVNYINNAKFESVAIFNLIDSLSNVILNDLNSFQPLFLSINNYQVEFMNSIIDTVFVKDLPFSDFEMDEDDQSLQYDDQFSTYVDDTQINSVVKYTDDQLYSFASQLWPYISQMLSCLGPSELFLKLLKTSTKCIPDFQIYQEFIGKFIECCKFSRYDFCSDFVRTIFASSPQNFTEISEFYFQIIQASILIAKRYVENEIYDIPCQIWNEMLNYNINFYGDQNFTKGIFNEFFIFVRNIPYNTNEFLDLITCVSSIFTECFDDTDPNLYIMEITELFKLFLTVSDVQWSNAIDIAISSIFQKYSQQLTPVIVEQLNHPSPGLLIILCQCRSISQDILYKAALIAIDKQNEYPPFHLSLFICRIGKFFTQFNDQWFLILINSLKSGTFDTIQALNNFLTANPEYISQVSSQDLHFILEKLQTITNTNDIIIKSQVIPIIEFFHKFSKSYLLVNKLSPIISDYINDALKEGKYEHFEIDQKLQHVQSICNLMEDPQCKYNLESQVSSLLQRRM